MPDTALRVNYRETCCKLSQPVWPERVESLCGQQSSRYAGQNNDQRDGPIEGKYAHRGHYLWHALHIFLVRLGIHQERFYLVGLFVPVLSMSRKLWVLFFQRLEGVHREVTFQSPLLAAPQGYLRSQRARTHLV